jgi:gamma-butyrobetaine dioxygenase
MQKHLADCAVKPKVVRDIADLRSLLEKDGAAMIDGPECDAEATRALARQIFAEKTLAIPDAARVFEGGEFDRARANASAHTATPAHTDGFAYGDLYPDYMLLSCVHHCAKGGESVLIDGYRIEKYLQAQADSSWAGHALRNVVIDQTEDNMQTAVSPIIMHNGRERIMVRKTLNQKPCEDSKDSERDARMIALWCDTINAAYEHAPRFKLRAGQTLIVDNYRLMHGRDPYEDLQRMLWRVWVWTTDALGVPDLPLASDTRHAVSSTS